MPSPAQVAAGRTVLLPTGDYPTDLQSGVLPVLRASGTQIQPNVRGRYLPPGWDDSYQLALASVLTAPFGLAILGASFESGGSATTDILKTAWWPLAAKQVLAKYGATRFGDFFSIEYSLQWMPNNACPSGYPVTFDLAATSTTAVGPLLNSTWSALNNGANPLMHYTHNPNLGYSNLSGDIVYWDAANASGQNFTWNLNGGAVQTSPNYTGAGIMRRISWNQNTPGWSAAGNVVNIMTQSAANSLAIIGFCAYPGASGPGASGIGFAWMAQSALTLNELLRTDRNTGAWTGGLVEKIAVLGGSTSTSAPYVMGTFGFPFATAPIKMWCVGIFDDWQFYMRMNDPTGVAAGGPLGTFGGNPYPQGGADPSLFRYGLWKLRKMSQALLSSMVFTLGPIPSGFYSDVNVTGYLPQNWGPWRDQYDAVARQGQCAIIDHDQLWAERGFTLGYQLQNNPHITDSGNAARANDIAGLL